MSRRQMRKYRGADSGRSSAAATDRREPYAGRARSPGTAWERWARDGVPQFRQPHFRRFGRQYGASELLRRPRDVPMAA
jgi:hypothetical protein